MQNLYQHTQFGSRIMLYLAPALAVAAFIMLLMEFNGISMALFFIIALVVVNLMTMTVVVKPQAVIVSLGPGLLRVSYPIDTIENCRVVDNPPFTAWGLHWTRAGWILNVAGSQSVDLEMANGNQVLIGSDEPEKLACAIENAMLAQKRLVPDNLH